MVVLGSAEGNGKISQRDVFVAAVSIVVAAIGAGLFANSCSGGGGSNGASTGDPPGVSDGAPGDAAAPPATDGERPAPATGGAGDDARTPDSVYLSDLDPITGPAATGSAHLAGADYPNSVATSYSCLDEVFAYALDAEWSTFHATLGVTTAAQAEDVFQLRVYVDGEQSGPRYELGKFATEEITVDVSGAIELRLHFYQDRCLDGQAVLGDARLNR